MTAPDYIVWKITESEEELRASLSHPEYFEAKIRNLKPGSRRMMEILSVRRALKELMYGEEKRIVYDRYGKPSIDEPDAPFISFSHTKHYVAVIISDVPVGIDIERRGDRVQRVVPQFLTPDEVTVLSLTPDIDLAFHLAWSGKESAFKVLGQSFYDLKKLTSIVCVDMERKLILLHVEGRELPMRIHFDFTEDYVLTWVQD
ncbi:MAG: 4'-phosphopantetheinyl transferase superfamily protein, partial [Bacteroidales bacterium]|nr:4'-phosphopantetheinyl transferase superfamily protein [Bacteroidales bacterium]